MSTCNRVNVTRYYPPLGLNHHLVMLLDCWEISHDALSSSLLLSYSIRVHSYPILPWLLPSCVFMHLFTLNFLLCCIVFAHYWTTRAAVYLLYFYVVVFFHFYYKFFFLPYTCLRGHCRIRSWKVKEQQDVLSLWSQIFSLISWARLPTKFYLCLYTHYYSLSSSTLSLSLIIPPPSNFSPLTWSLKKKTPYKHFGNHFLLNWFTSRLV